MTHEEVTQRLEYRDGLLYWKYNPDRPKYWNTKYAGKVAGHFRKDGYYVVNIDRVLYLGHRVIWLICKGMWPEFLIDHEDQNPSNCSIDNLRQATVEVNRKNSKRYTNNTSGKMGVHWDKLRKKWMAQVKVDRRQKNLGRFDTYEEAVAIRKEAELIYGYHKNHDPDTFKLEEL